MELANLYSSINSRSKPIAQDELTGATTYCKAIWTVDGWHLHKFYELLEMLKPLETEGVFYDLSGTKGKLHWTLFQLNTFPVDPLMTADDANIVKNIIYNFPRLKLKFVGISKSRYGLFLNGYPNYDVNIIRNQLRSQIKDIVEPHPQDICHATLFRFTKPPSGYALTLIDKVLDIYKSTHIADCIPKTWEYGYGTWLQQSRIIIETWPSVPHWILHRGLKDGPNLLLENQENVIKARVLEGWDVEIDIWFIDGTFMLGHDRPCESLKDISLLTTNGVWVHLKNLEAVAHIPKNAHCFIHDSDPATFTSNGFLWCYPGNILPGYHKSVTVLPERVGIKFPTLENTAAVCSDFLPSYFLK